MSKQPVPKQLPVPDVSYKVGEECRYWLKFGEYPHQQAIEEGWLDAQGKLTPAGLQAIVSEQEMIKKREELTSSIKLKARNLKSKKVRGISFKTRFSSKTQKKIKSGFVIEVKILLSKIDGKFVHFAEDGENCRLVIRVPAEKNGTTSHTFNGSVSDIRRKLDAFIDEIEENKK